MNRSRLDNLIESSRRQDELQHERQLKKIRDGKDSFFKKFWKIIVGVSVVIGMAGVIIGILAILGIL